MKKTLSISLAQLNFVLEDDAYQKLASYLEQVRTYFSTNPDKEEIVKDIEYSIADKFTHTLSPTKQIITLEDTERVIHEIGTTHDFKQTEAMSDEKSSADPEENQKKRLFRDEDHKVIAGVCAGIANYFDVDVVWIRALFGILLFTPLVGVVSIFYIILWSSTPAATNVIDKLKMQGESVTLEKIAAQIKDRVNQENTPEKNVLKKIVNIPVVIITTIINLLKKIIPILVVIFSSLGIVFLTLITLGITYVAGIILFFSDSPLMYFPLKDFPTTPAEYGLILLGYFTLLLPIIFVVSLFISLIKKRYILGTAGTISLAGIWMVVLLGLGLLSVGLVPNLQQKIKKESIITKTIDFKTLSIDEFDAIFLNTPHDSHTIRTTISQGPTYSIKVKGNQNQVDNLKFSKSMKPVADLKELSIIYDPAPQVCLGCNRGAIDVEITLPDLKYLSVGNRNFVTLKDLNIENLKLDLFGRAAIDGDRLKIKSLETRLSGYDSELNLKHIEVVTTALYMAPGASVLLSGSTTELKLTGDRRGALDISDLKVKNYHEEYNENVYSLQKPGI